MVQDGSSLKAAVDLKLYLLWERFSAGNRVICFVNCSSDGELTGVSKVASYQQSHRAQSVTTKRDLCAWHRVKHTFVHVFLDEVKNKYMEIYGNPFTNNNHSH